MSKLRLKEYFAAKLLLDLLGNVKSESDSLRIKLFRGIKKSEQLEEFVLVLLFYPNSRVNNLNLDHSVT